MDPGYSTVGALQAALDNIVRVFSLLLDNDSHPGAPREGAEGVERGGGDSSQLDRAHSPVQVRCHRHLDVSIFSF